VGRAQKLTDVALAEATLARNMRVFAPKTGGRAADDFTSVSFLHA
jgi:hypothetical protein